MPSATHSLERPAPPPAFRWLVLVVISLAMFGNYYVYDAISPLADVLQKQLGFTDGNIGLLQGIYSVPNIVMVAERPHSPPPQAGRHPHRPHRR